MNPKESVVHALQALPDDAPWARVLEAVHGAAGWGAGDGGVVRDTGPGWAVEQAAIQAEEAMRGTYDVVVERDEEGFFVASVPGLRGCHTQARSLEQLLERVQEAIQVALDATGGGGTHFVGIRRVTVPA